MKFIFENWKKFINENIKTATRLSIFDFDETIAFTEGHINVIILIYHKMDFKLLKSPFR